MTKGDVVLVTGGAGYIGSHTCVELLQCGYDVTVVDNLSNSTPVAIERIAELTGRSVDFHRTDLLDPTGVAAIFATRPVAAVIHLAGLKAIAESVANPARYYDNNVVGSLTLFRQMQRFGVNRLVFSSSCTVYGEPARVPIDESGALRPVNPYGRTKLIVEQMLGDFAAADGWHALALRYFNPVGAHSSGRLGETPSGIPNNLMPYVMQVAAGLLDKIRVFGDDYPTVDGTPVRDYVHVVDVARAHVAALACLDAVEGLRAVNLGSGRGHSVLEVIAAASEAVGRPLPYQIAPRRVGDVACVFADPRLAAELLGWSAERDIAEMCRDHWRWQRDNALGYGSSILPTREVGGG